MRLRLIIGEVFTGLRRNISMVISVVLVTFVSLTFVGAAMLMQSQIAMMQSFWVERAQVGVFMCSPLSDTETCAEGAASEEQVASVRDALAEPTLAPLVTEVLFDDRQATFDKYPEELRGLLTVDDVNEVFWVRLADPANVDVIIEAFSGVIGVEEVIDQMPYLDPLFSALTVTTYIAIGIAALMLIAAVLLIATTIRLSAFARRREIGIMRLVGASNRFIQTPFVLEGVFSAVLGSLLAGGAVIAGVHFGVDGYLAGRVPSIQAWVGINEALWVVPALIAIGAVLAAFSAGFAIRRWLRA